MMFAEMTLKCKELCIVGGVTALTMFFAIAAFTIDLCLRRDKTKKNERK